MKKRYILLLFFTGSMLLLPSCLKDLDTVTLDEDILTTEKLYQDPNNYINVLAKCYMGLAVGGNEGGDGSADISGIDGGFSVYLRNFWYHQELTTDEAIIGWNDQTIKDLHYQTWTPSDPFVSAMYYRVMYQVTLCNTFILNTSPAKLDERGIGNQYRETFATYHAEARFLRALSYWHGLDLFRNMPFVTENDPIANFFPKQKDAKFLFKYIEDELIAITDGSGGDDLKEAHTNEYARADKAAAFMLLAKLYLNASIYIDEDRNADCIAALDKVFDAGYTLEPNFQHLFMTDNNNSNEIIFPIAYDGLKTQSWGGTTLLVHAAIGGLMGAGPDGKANTDSMLLKYGVGGGWGGLRTTKELVAKFGDIATTQDSRAIFFTEGQNLEIKNVTLFTDGYAVPKFLNVASDNARTPGQDRDFVDTDFPMFRLADAYLMYAEAFVRGGGGDAAKALNYMNDLRLRAYGNNSGDITSTQLTLDFILDERSRELLWEGHRRTDLIRFGKFTEGNYNWAWKGFTKAGVSTSPHRNIFPIPANDLNANPNLVQNSDY